MKHAMCGRGVNRKWRFYFTIEDDEYHLHEIKAHPK
jgi:hypothetical protein